MKQKSPKQSRNDLNLSKPIFTGRYSHWIRKILSHTNQIKRPILAVIGILMVFSPASFSQDIEHLSATAFRLTLTTEAKPEKIWQLWQDVDNWKSFDERLEYSYLRDGHRFQSGAKGVLKGKDAPKTRFVLSKVETGHYFEETLLLPLWQSVLLIRKLSVNDAGLTEFTHEVHIQGGLRHIYSWFLKGPFKGDLVKVMHKMKQIAENRDKP